PRALPCLEGSAEEKKEDEWSGSRGDGGDVPQSLPAREIHRRYDRQGNDRVIFDHRSGADEKQRTPDHRRAEDHEMLARQEQQHDCPRLEISAREEVDIVLLPKKKNGHRESRDVGVAAENQWPQYEQPDRNRERVQHSLSD